MTPTPMQLHAIPFVLVMISVIATVAAGRRLSTSRVHLLARVLAVLVIGSEVAWWVDSIARHAWSIRYNLPLHLCEAAALVVAAALWTRRAILVEIGYFWGLGGALQAMLTPVIPFRYPHFIWFQYWIEHGLIVLGAIFLVTVLQLRPRAGAVGRIAMVTVGYAAAVGAADWATGANYMYLRRLPATGTITDWFGPWPVYLVPCAGVALLLFSLLYLPFRSEATTEAQQQAA